MKKFESLKKEIGYLSLSRKLILFSGLLTFLFLFFPWGTRGEQGEGFEFLAKSFNAFQTFPIFGWLLLILSLGSLFFLWSEVAYHKNSYKKMSHSSLWMLLGGVGVYTIFIALFVLNSTYLKGFDSQFSLKIGIFLVLFMQALTFMGGYIGKKDDEKTYLKQSLSRPHDIDTSKADLSPEPPGNPNQMSLGDRDL